MVCGFQSCQHSPLSFVRFSVGRDETRRLCGLFVFPSANILRVPSQNNNINTGNDFFKNVTVFKFFATRVTNISYIYVEIKYG
jgi:hypothetical protein